MSAAYLQHLVPPALALALPAGTAPAIAIHPIVVEAMKMDGIELSGQPQRVTEQLVAQADVRSG